MQVFTASEQLGVNLREFFQSCPQLLIGGDPLPGLGLLVWDFEQELQHVALRQAAGQIIEGAVFLTSGASTVGFATGSETLDIRSTQEVAGNGQAAQERGFALAQSQGGSAAKLVNLSQLLGEDSQSIPLGKKKENAPKL
jgi:hypothetical protein